MLFLLFYPILASLFWYTLSLFLKRSDVVDVAWGFNATILAILTWILSGVPLLSPQGIILLLISFWGLRLGYHIITRLRKKDEDPRYAKYRSEWGKLYPLKAYLFFFLGQSILIAIIAMAVFFVAYYGAIFTWTIWSVLGLFMWLLGFFFEFVSDRQLAHFLSDPENRGKLMTHGLWKYSRHPNYFGEATLWWGIFFITISFPLGWIAMLSPIAITFFLLKVTGVPLAEKSLEDHPDFAQYQRTTSLFIPLPPKR